MTITIPPELVALVRDGLYFDLQGCLEEMDSAIRSRDRLDIRVAIEAGLAWAGDALALLDVVGWLEVANERAVEVDVCRHREVLLGAISTRTQSERAVQEDANASEEDRSRAIVREKQLAELATRVQAASSAGTVLVPASLVDLLREALVSVVADCAGAIEDDGREHPGNLDGTLLRRFDAYRALLEQVGLHATVPAAAVEVDSAHRGPLVGVLRERRDYERYLMWAVDMARSRRRIGRIEEFMSSAGLQDEQDRRTALALCDESPVAWGCE
jgi:hypothetical protein